jgi:O6-methylguanine-DNA--protein-cysteine methyltransferase
VGIRVSKSFKVAPGIRVRVNAKSTSMTLGGKGMRYTVNSTGRRTATARIPGAGVSVQHTSGSRKSRPSSRSAKQTPRAQKPTPRTVKPARHIPRGEKRLYEILAKTGGTTTRATRAVSCEQMAAKFPKHRIAALTLAGLLVASEDRAMATRTLTQVFASRIEVADDKFLRRYAPVKSFAMPGGGGRQVMVPLSRDLIGMRLVQLHTLAGNFGWAEAALAELKDTPTAHELLRMLANIRYNHISADRSQGA